MPELTEADLLSQAADFDAGQTDHNDAPPVEVQAESAETVAESKPDPVAAPKAEASDAKPAEEAKAEVPGGEPAAAQVAQTKVQKEKERRDKTWAEINATKEQLKREREEIQKLREDFERQRVEAQKAVQDVYRDEHGFTPQDYRNAAEKFEEQGDDDKAALARKAAERAENKAREHGQKLQEQRFMDGWRKTYEECCQQEPDLKNQDSDLYKEVLKTIEAFPPLKADPKGILYALQAVKLTRKAKEAEALQKQYEELKKQHESLNQKTSVSGGVVPVKAQAKSFDDMSPAEQEKYLRSKAREIDGGDL